MLMLFLITAVPLEMEHEIKHFFLLSPHTAIAPCCRHWGDGWGVELWGWSCTSIGVLKAFVHLPYISASFNTALCIPHTCKTAFWWRGGQRGKSVRRENEGCWQRAVKLKDCFHYSLFIQWTATSCFVFTSAPINPATYLSSAQEELWG